jgi:HEAT repeat protein
MDLARPARWKKELFAPPLSSNRTQTVIELGGLSTGIPADHLGGAIHMAETNYQALIKQLEYPDQKIRHQARLELMRGGEAAIPSLAQAILSGNAPLRWQAAKALSQMGTPAAIPVLIDILRENQFFGVRWQAAEGLIHFQRASLAPLLRSLMEHADSTSLCEGAHHVLRTLHDEGIESEVIEKTVHALENIEPALKVPWAAQEALQHLHHVDTRS